MSPHSEIHSTPPPPYTLQTSTPPIPAEPWSECTPLIASSTKKNSVATFIRFLIPMALILAGFFLLGALVVPKESHSPEESRRMFDKWERERQAHDTDIARWRQLEAEYQADTALWRQLQTQYLQQRDQWLSERALYERERKIFQGDRIRWAKEAQERKDEQTRWEREKNTPRWTPPEAEERCISYESSWHKATLYNIPNRYNWYRACRETRLIWNGVTWNSPDRCEKTDNGGVIGYWLRDHEGPLCRTYWSKFNDMGCVTDGSRKRRIEAMLEGLLSGYDWLQMCATTPADVRGEHATPTYCQARDGWRWMAGIWEIDDDEC